MANDWNYDRDRWENTNAASALAGSFVPTGAFQAGAADQTDKMASGDNAADREYAQWAMRNLSDSDLKDLARENAGIARYLDSSSLYNIRIRPEERAAYKKMMDQRRQQSRQSRTGTSALNKQMANRLDFGGTQFGDALQRSSAGAQSRALANSLRAGQKSFQEGLNRPDRFKLVDDVRGAAQGGLNTAGEIVNQARTTTNTIIGGILDAYLPGFGAGMQAGNAAETAHNTAIYTGAAENVGNRMNTSLDDAFYPDRDFSSAAGSQDLAFSGGQEEATAFRRAAARRRY